jgi:SAM-dependent methyltransferase
MFHRLRHGRPVNLLRYHLYRDVLLARPRRHSCNICGWRGRRFLTYLHRHVLCPQCGSQVRHRLIAAALKENAIGRRCRIAAARVLHISPEYCLGLILQPSAKHYVRADWADMNCDVRQDITRMPFRDHVFDTVVVCDTLEHVVDDRGALEECRRVLSPGGFLVATVPQSDHLYATREARLTPEQAVSEYGQMDHVRNYGADFGDRLATAGFAVTCVDASAFQPAMVTRHVLRPPVRLQASWGWNDRRIYFGERR